MPGYHGYSVSSVLMLGTPAYQFLEYDNKKAVNAVNIDSNMWIFE